MDFLSLCFFWWLCIGDLRWLACILKCCVSINHGSSSSDFLWDVAVLLVLLCSLFLLIYRCVHFVVVFGTVGTGVYGSVIGMEVVAGRESSCWFGKVPGEVAGKEQERV